MNLQQLIASRYLFSKKNISLISTLTWISITGVTIGTALLIIVLSVFNGFYSLIQQLLLTNDPHIRIEHLNEKFFSRHLLSEQEAWIQQLGFVEYYIQGNVLISRSGRNEFVSEIRGITPTMDSEEIYPISSGEFNFTIQNKTPGVIISEQLAQDLRLYVDDEIVLLTADGIRRSLTQFSGPRMLSFSVNGFFSLQPIANRPLIIADLAAVQRLFYVKDKISGVDIRLADENDAFLVQKELSEKLGGSFVVKTWYDLQKPLYDIMQIEKWASYVILMIIVLVAILNIVGSLTMIVLQKKKDIGILKTMGLIPIQVKQVFQLQGLFIGLIGCGIGGSIGLGLSYLQKQIGFVKLAGADSFIINSYPIDIHFGDVTTVILSCLFLCVLASWFPASRASKVTVIEALRYE